jgi:hypothetical protein
MNIEGRIPRNLPAIHHQKYYILILLYSSHEFLTAMGLQEANKKVEVLGDRLSVITKFVDWVPFCPLLDDMYNNRTEVGGRPNSGAILMFKVLLIQ